MTEVPAERPRSEPELILPELILPEPSSVNRSEMRRTLMAWQRTSMACVVVGLVLGRVIGAQAGVGVTFCILGMVYSISAFVHDRIQAKLYNTEGFLVTNNRLIFMASFFTLLADVSILLLMD